MDIKEREALLQGSGKSLTKFREKLKIYLKEKNINNNEVLLFISKEVYEKEILAPEKYVWSKGLLIYAVTGVPLVNGIQSLKSGYYNAYKEDSLMLSKKDFIPKKACSEKNAKFIILVSSLDNQNFSVYDCSTDIDNIKKEKNVQ